MKIAAYTPLITPSPYDSVTTSKHLPEIVMRYDEIGGFNPLTGTITPFKNVLPKEVGGVPRTFEYLDNITAAVEAGHVDPETFLSDFFETMKDWQSLAARLEDCADDRVNDRHFNAFTAAFAGDGFCITYPEIGDTFVERFVLNERQQLDVPEGRPGAERAPAKT